MLHMSLSKRVFITVTIVVTAQLLYFSWHSMKNTRQTVYHSIIQDLTQIVMLLEQKMPGTYDELLSSSEATGLSEIESSLRLNQSLQPVLNSVSEKWPGFGMGYYARQNRIVAVIPFSRDMLGRSAPPEVLNVYRTKDLYVTEIDDGFSWGEGTKLIGAIYPLYQKNEIIGHVWANIKQETLDQAVLNAVLEKVLEYLLIWMVLILVIAWTMRRIKNTLSEVAAQISGGDTLDTSKFIKIPELVPVLETVETLKKKLKAEYEEREDVKEEICRLDRLNIVGEMAATLAHEIRNPIAVVMGYTQLLSQKNSEFAGQSAVIMSELKRVNQIIEDFLSLARNNTVSLTEEQLNDLIRSFFPLLFAEATNNEVSIELDLQWGLPKVRINKKEIQQLILNLVRNAIDVTKASGVVKIATKLDLKDHSVLLIISDNGCGIPQEQLGRIFDPFFTTKSNGTGLGLSVCKNIIDKHHGKIEVDSKLNVGTVFTIYLPLSPASKSDGIDETG